MGAVQPHLQLYQILEFQQEQEDGGLNCHVPDDLPLPSAVGEWNDIFVAGRDLSEEIEQREVHEGCVYELVEGEGLRYRVVATIEYAGPEEPREDPVEEQILPTPAP